MVIVREKLWKKGTIGYSSFKKMFPEPQEIEISSEKFGNFLI